MNHGCSRAFSAVYSWREEEGVMVVHAIRDIKKGKVGGDVLAEGSWILSTGWCGMCRKY